MASSAGSAVQESKEDSKESIVAEMASKLPDKGSKLPIVFGPVHSRNVGAVRLLVDRVLPVTYSDSFWSKLVQGTNALSVMAYLSDLFVGTICTRLERRPDGKNRAYIMILAVLPAYRTIGVGTQLLRRLMLKVMGTKDASAKDEDFGTIAAGLVGKDGKPTALSLTKSSGASSSASAPASAPAPSGGGGGGGRRGRRRGGRKRGGGGAAAAAAGGAAKPGSAGSAAPSAECVEVYLHVQSTNEGARKLYRSAGFDEVKEVKNYYGRLEDKDAMLLRWCAPGSEPSVGTGADGDAPSKAAAGEGGAES